MTKAVTKSQTHERLTMIAFLNVDKTKQCAHFRHMLPLDKKQQTHRQIFFLDFGVRSDRNSGRSDVCRCTLEVLHRPVHLLPHRCVRNSCSSDVCWCTLEVLHRAVDLLRHRCVSRAKFLLSDSDESESPAGRVPPSRVMHRRYQTRWS